MARFDPCSGTWVCQWVDSLARRVVDPGSTAPAQNVLTSITDPRGLTTSIYYKMDTVDFLPYQVQNVEGAEVQAIVAPNGNYTLFDYLGGYGNIPPDGIQTAAYEMLGPFPGVNGWTTCYQQMGFSGYTSGGTCETYEDVTAPLDSDQFYAFAEIPAEQNQLVDDHVGYAVEKNYDQSQETLTSCETVSSRTNEGWWSTDEMTPFSDYLEVDQTYSYNFMGNPLTEADTQYQTTNIFTGQQETGYNPLNQAKQYAYWGQDKYFQQKAVVDRYGTSDQRIAYTDYYPNTANAGSRGQTYKTYSDPYTLFNTRPPTSGWQASIAPDTSNYDAYSSLTTYNSYGQATDVKKLQTETGTDPSITVTDTETSTTYYATGSPDWGEPSTVTEDVGGTGHVNRVTQTLSYDPGGYATQTEDAANHIFNTSYVGNATGDHQVSNISEADSYFTGQIVSYNYGTTPGAMDYGQVDSVIDGVSQVANTNVTDIFDYDSTPGDPGIGQVSKVTEQWPWDTSGSVGGYNVQYTYTPIGDRGTTTYTTDNGTTQWQYDNYCSVGAPQNGGSPSRVPQTMRLLDQNGNPTPEEFHYLYDGKGGLQAASFDMTPASGFTPTGNNPWYDPSDPPSTRARVVYDNGAGVNNAVSYSWDSWGGSSTPIASYSYTYDPYTLLKETAAMSDGNPHSENYSYAPYLDYLVGANYGATSESWSYDAAGNRLTDSATGSTNWTYDGLNRLLTSPGYTYSNDILGNRLSNSVSSETWDQLNRMNSFTSGSTTTNYLYRSDGMRVQKAVPSGNSTLFAYDGQMGFEDTDAGSNAAVNDYAIGPRGIDRIAQTTAGGTNIAYPIYDGHGNMTCTIQQNFGTTGQLEDTRSFDAWGNASVIGNQQVNPKGRYCAALGHKQDDESGLIYMRARYEDPTTGRFVSEDSKRSGANWTLYAGNNPIHNVDPDGADYVDWALFLGSLIFTVIGLYCAGWEGGAGAAGVALALGSLIKGILAGRDLAAKNMIIDARTEKIIELENQQMNSLADDAADNSLAGPALRALSSDAGQDLGALIDNELEDAYPYGWDP